MSCSELHDQLNELGLKRIQYLEKSVYEVDMTDEATDSAYTFTVSILRYEDGETAVQLEEAGMDNTVMVPLHIRCAALNKLREIEQICRNSRTDPAVESAAHATNGSMAPNMDEMKKLGNEMKQMKTNSELLEENMIPDPIQ
ncbi:hypothetical protein B5M42_020665 [Paenibacillus athensensis]|uniref:Uncharacterized protein n=1 Tax=Paenibacillus athensensis TaxID=1967502 RepID=A0A4Y8PYN5_9BACL|nr:hypothetical protein [Paenibacillus athensensis]MCD1261216.1 hypothetical protein [Paenibacillus athensensis]